MNLNVADAKEFTALPSANYPGEIIYVEDKDTKNGEGKMLEVRIELITQTGGLREVRDWCLYQHSNEIAENIGRVRIKQLATAASLDPAKLNPDELVGKKVVVDLDIDKDDDTRNVVKCYMASNQPEAPAPALNADIDDDDDVPF